MTILELTLKKIAKDVLKAFLVTAATAAANKGIDHLYDMHIKKKKAQTPKKPSGGRKKAP